jgi:hypothetical protein
MKTQHKQRKWRDDVPEATKELGRNLAWPNRITQNRGGAEVHTHRNTHGGVRKTSEKVESRATLRKSALNAPTLIRALLLRARAHCSCARTRIAPARACALLPPAPRALLPRARALLLCASAAAASRCAASTAPHPRAGAHLPPSARERVCHLQLALSPTRCTPDFDDNMQLSS